MAELPEEIDEISLSSVESILYSRANDSYSQEFASMSAKKHGEASLEYSYNFDEVGMSDKKSASVKRKLAKPPSFLQVSGYSDDFEQSEVISPKSETLRQTAEQSRPIYADVVKEILRLNKDTVPVSVNDVKKYNLFMKKKRATDRRSEYVKELMVSRQISDKLRNDITLRDSELFDLRGKQSHTESSLAFLKDTCNKLRDDVSLKSKEISDLTEKCNHLLSENQSRADALILINSNHQVALITLIQENKTNEALKIAAETAYSKLENRVAMRESDAMDVFVSQLPSEIAKRIELEEERVFALSLKLQEREEAFRLTCLRKEDEIREIGKRQEEEAHRQWSRMSADMEATRHDQHERRKAFDAEISSFRSLAMSETLTLKSKQEELLSRQMDVEADKKRLDDDWKELRMQQVLSEPTIRSSRLAMERLNQRETELNERESELNRKSSEMISSQSRLVSIGHELNQQKAQVIQRESQLMSLKDALSRQVAALKQERINLATNKSMLSKQEMEISNQMISVRSMMKMMKQGSYGGRRGVSNQLVQKRKGKSDVSSSISSLWQEFDDNNHKHAEDLAIDNMIDDYDTDINYNSALEAIDFQVNDLSDPIITTSSISIQPSESLFHLSSSSSSSAVPPIEFESLRKSKEIFGY